MARNSGVLVAPARRSTNFFSFSFCQCGVWCFGVAVSVSCAHLELEGRLVDLESPRHGADGLADGVTVKFEGHCDDGDDGGCGA